MKNNIFLMAAALMFAFAFQHTISVAVAFTQNGNELVKLPYESGQQFVVVQGYDSPPTHVGKDYYALDLSQDGCAAYGKPAVAAFSGTVLLAQDEGYNGGYGTQILVKTAGGDGLVARYAHMIPGTIPASALAVGAAVAQGEPLGEIGDTGLVAGAACPEHPGTHIHFAIYGEESDGSFVAYKPEPISDYTNIEEGNWYLSDNTIAADSISGLSAIVGEAIGGLVGPSGNANNIAVQNNETSSTTELELASASAETVSPAAPIIFQSTPSQSSSQIFETSTSQEASSTTSAPALASGGSSGSVSASPAPVQPSVPPQTSPDNDNSSEPIFTPTSTPPAPPQITPPEISSASFDSSTLAVDLSWLPAQNASGTVSYEIFKIDSTNASSNVEIGETTSTTFSYPLANSDFGTSTDAAAAADSFAVQSIDAAGNTSTLAVATTSIPNWSAAIQPVDKENSNGSWYDDNWYDLGTGFYGLVRSLTFEGSVDGSDYRASHLWLDEYLDAGYTQLNQTWTISDNAPFTDGTAKVTIGGLAIPLQPNKYYRLRTYQDYQNRSVILAGISATGTAMWNEFIPGTGRVEHDYSFYPYIQAVMIPNYPPLAPPNPVTNATTSFDSLNSIINISWPAATDPDTTSSLLTYQINDSTSTSLDDARWQSVGKNLSGSFPVVFGNSYLLGIRAVDDFGNISAPLIAAWNFPAGYAPIPSQLDHSSEIPSGAQKITFLATTTISGIALWTISDPNGAWSEGESFVSVHQDNNGSIGPLLAASAPVDLSPRWNDREEMYSFSPAVALPEGSYWFSVDAGPNQNTNPTYIFGSSGDAYSGGQWSTAPGQDAYFRIQEAAGP